MPAERVVARSLVAAMLVVIAVGSPRPAAAQEAVPPDTVPPKGTGRCGVVDAACLIAAVDLVTSPTVAIGDPVRVRVRVRPAAGVSATVQALSLRLPDELAPAAAPVVTGAGATLKQSVSASRLELSSVGGSRIEVEWDTTVAILAPGTVTMKADAWVDAPVGRPVSVSASSAPLVPASKLVLEADAPDAVVAGAIERYTVTARNGGPGPFEAVEIDVAPPGEVEEIPTSCQTIPGGLRCGLGALAAGATGGLAFGIRMPDGPVGSTVEFAVRATAVPAPARPAAVRVTSRLQAPPALAAASVALAGPARIGARVELVATVDNVGSVPLDEAVVTVPLPDHVTVVDVPERCSTTGDSLSCRFGPVAVGERAEVAVGLRVASTPPEPSITFAPSLSWFDGAADRTESVAPAVLALVASPVPWLRSPSKPLVLAPGESGAVVFDLGTDGPGDLDPLSLEVEVPAELVVTGPEPCVAGSGSLVCPVADRLAAGDSRSFPLAVRFGEASGPGSAPRSLTFVGRVRSAAGQFEPVEVAVVVSESPPIPPMSPVLTLLTSGEAVVGAPWHVELVLTNPDQAPTEQAEVVLQLPGALDAVTVGDVPGAVCGATGAAWLCTVDPIAPAGSRTIRLGGRVRPDVDPNGALRVSASVRPVIGPRRVASPIAVTAPLLARSALAVAVPADPAEVVAGLPASWPIAVVNPGPSPATSVVLTIVPSAGVDLVPPPGCGLVERAVRCDLGAVLGRRDLVVGGRIAPWAVAASIETTVTTATGELDLGDNVAAWRGAVDIRGALVIERRDLTGLDDGLLVAGRRASIGFAVVNPDGPSDLAGVTVRIPVPDAVPISGSSRNSSLVCAMAIGELRCVGRVAARERIEIDVEIEPPPSLPSGTVVRLAPDLAAGPGVELDASSADVVLESTTRADVQLPGLRFAGDVIAGSSFTATGKVIASGPSVLGRATLNVSVAADGGRVGPMSVRAAGQVCEERVTSTQVRCPLGDLSPGADLELSVEGSLAADTEPGAGLVVVAVVESDTPPTGPPAASSRRAALGSDVRARPILAVVGPTPSVPGSLELRVANTGPSVARAVRVVVQAPVGAALRAGGLSCALVGPGSFECTVARLAPGASAALRVEVADATDAQPAQVSVRATSIEIPEGVPASFPMNVPGGRRSPPPAVDARSRMSATFDLPGPAPDEPPSAAVVVRQELAAGVAVERVVHDHADDVLCEVTADQRSFTCRVSPGVPGPVRFRVDAVVIDPLPLRSGTAFTVVSSRYLESTIEAGSPDRSARAAPVAAPAAGPVERVVRVLPRSLVAGVPDGAALALAISLLAGVGWGRTGRSGRRRPNR
ncbi:MAG: hypothetical protein ACKO91_09485 [Acidimicrobiales bacterium]